MKRLALSAAIAIAALPFVAGAADVFDFDGETFDSASAASTKTSGTAVSSSGGSMLPPGIVEQVSVTMLPSVPKPGDIVSVRVDSYSTDLNKAYVVWTRNGTIIAEGTGVVSISFVAPAAGQIATIEMSAAKAGGGTVSKKITVAPADLDIIYEAETYTPPFFQGRAEFTNSSRVRLVAVPRFIDPDTGLEIPAADLVYTWRVDGSVDQSISGYGRYTADVFGELVSRGLEVEVEVESITSPLRARASLLVLDQQPDVAVYEDHPLYGVLFERAVDSKEAYPVSASEISLLAVPYSMDIYGLSDPRAKWSWLTGEGKGPTAASVTFRPEEGATGEARASIRVNHQNFAQYGDRGVTLNFGATGGFGTIASTTTTGNYTL